jgi:hypothetical protein
MDEDKIFLLMQREKMKELWDNKEDEEWEKIIQSQINKENRSKIIL